MDFIAVKIFMCIDKSYIIQLTEVYLTEYYSFVKDIIK